jgi:glutamate-ammonia-ligase adenylyltransferase
MTPTWICFSDLPISPEKGGGERLAASVVGRLTSVAGEGRLYDVDARLRPEGRNAPLLVTMGAYAKYLRNRASLWERQSLTRLRFVAGPERVGRDILRRVRKFVLESPLPEGWTREIVDMRKRMESRSRFRGDAPLDIKVGPGGMVDIEFTAQMIQLRMGREAGALLGRPVDEVLAAAPVSLVGRDEAMLLRGAYAFFRNIEKHLRITLEERGNLIPVDSRLWTLARCMGENDPGSFAAAVRERMKQTRECFLSIARRISEP